MTEESPGRSLVLELYRAALVSVHGRAVVERALESRRTRGFVVAAGKAACEMALGARDRMGPALEGGLVVTRRGHGRKLPGFEVLEAGHPLPDAASQLAAERVLSTVSRPGPDLVVLLSGGASALLAAPVPGVTLAEKRALTDALLRSGAGIEDVNAVRKHLSRIKGGQLARAARGSRGISTLLLSDVAGDRLDVIGSGPTAPDPTTYSDALDVLARFAIDAPPSVRRHLERGAAGDEPETPKAGDLCFVGVEHRVVASLSDALDAVDAAGHARGVSVERVPLGLVGEARDCGHTLGRRALRAKAREPRVLLAGGEPTVRVLGDGLGGRAQEAALAFAIEIEGRDGTVGLFCGTDGSDGPTDAAGACVDGGTLARARAAGLYPGDHLRRNDAYPLLDATGDLVRTGPTGTNVTDLALIALG